LLAWLAALLLEGRQRNIGPDGIPPPKNKTAEEEESIVTVTPSLGYEVCHLECTARLSLHSLRQSQTFNCLAHAHITYTTKDTG
jgi:hypothetical protein